MKKQYPSLSSSIIIPNYNGAAHLPALFTALAKQLKPRFELIFVDDASADSSLALVERAQSTRGLSDISFARTYRENTDEQLALYRQLSFTP